MWLGDVNDVMHRKHARRILGILKKSVNWVESCLGRRRLTFACSPWPCVGCARGLGRMEMSGVSLTLCGKTFKLKGNKKFRTWTKKSSSVFCVSGFLCSMYICYEHSMYVSHIHIWLWYPITFYLHLLKKVFITLHFGNSSCHYLYTVVKKTISQVWLKWLESRVIIWLLLSEFG